MNDCITGGDDFIRRNSGTIEANALVNIGMRALDNNSAEISIKGATTIGNTTGNNGIMANSTGIFNVNIALQTNDNGNPDGDILDAISSGATVNYF